VGTYKQKTFFVYSKKVSGRFINVAVGSFDTNGLPTNVKPLRRLKNNTKGRYFGICMYGEHLLSDDRKRPVIIVNGEHMAVICSWFFPQFDWLATGKLDKNGPEILSLLQGRTVHYVNSKNCITSKARPTLRLLKSGNLLGKIIKLNEELHSYDLIRLHFKSFVESKKMYHEGMGIYSRHIVHRTEEEKQHLRTLANELHQEGLSIRQIAFRLQVSKSNIGRMLNLVS